MVSSKKFEIRVALLGYVSVGKTTVLNAIFRDKFSEVSMKRTTAGINFFRVMKSEPLVKEEPDAKSASDDKKKRACTIPLVATGSAKKAKTANETLKEITALNRELREARKIKEMWFDIELDHDEPLCAMRDDTSLVLVDIPGINEADTDNIYMAYIQEHWGEFDCVIVVMDARQGVNTEEQVDLLKLVKDNLATKRRVPTIILFNKVDDPDEPEQASLVSEALVKVAEVFKIPGREKGLKKAVDSLTKKEPKPVSTTCPIFLATSANHAFFYRTASLLTFSQFKVKFGMDIINSIGKLEVGRHQWKKLNPEKKYTAVFEAVCEDSDYKERLEATNFDKFLKALSLCVGGEESQLKVLHAQVDFAIRSMDQIQVSVQTLRSLYDKSVV